MDRTRRISQFWNWLPAFRAVAESHQLSFAARELRVSASALSRTIKLLEGEVGIDLFERRGRTLVLNHEGEEFLLAVRDAMRRIHTTLEKLEGNTLRGDIRIGGPGPLLREIILPKLPILRQELPELVPRIRVSEEEHATAALLRGDLDVALLVSARATPGIDRYALATLEYRIFRGRGSGQPTRVRDADYLDLDFVALETDQDASASEERDGWPSEFKRKVTLRVDDMQSQVDACASGEWVALLPVRVGQSSGLTELSGSIRVERTVSLLTRERLDVHERVGFVLKTLGIGPLEAPAAAAS